ncbi:MAG: ParB-like nuclease domain-containing protein, partial [Oscillospiraceae bacterium]|nr:ParB-like nuclease domain-containing protein [Oscillospiraceae bacterium]
GHNKDFSDGLKLFDRYFIGPIKMPLNLFTRCCGPEENMIYRVDAAWFENHVTELEKVIETNGDMPPMIVHYVDGIFELNDGNHRLEAYKRKGVTEYFVIVWITKKEEYDEFITKYAQYL